MAYPSPPQSTSSPKVYPTKSNKDGHDAAQIHLDSVADLTHVPPVSHTDSYYNFPVDASTSTVPALSASDSYYHPQAEDMITLSSNDNTMFSAQDTHSHPPAQVTYFTTSLPTSPTLHQEPLPFSASTTPYPQDWDPSSSGRPSERPSKLCRPHKQHSLSSTISKPYRLSDAYGARPQRPGRFTPPLISSPLRPPYTRPRPRPGLLRGVWKKISDAVRSILNFGRKHPFWTGSLAFLPVALGLGIAKAARGVGRFISGEHDFWDREGPKHSWTASRTEQEHVAMRQDKRHTDVKERAWWSDDIFSEFRGFGASRLGTESLDGVMKIMQMLV